MSIFHETLRCAFHGMFLPQNFRADGSGSVSVDYTNYQFYDTLQGLMSYLKAVFCTVAFLRGLGVGGGEDASAEPLLERGDGHSRHSSSSGGGVEGAVLVWILRDATGMVAGLAFGVPWLTRRFGDRSQVRFWRMAAECCRGVAGLLEILSQLFVGSDDPAKGLWFAATCCLSSVFASASSVMGSCTRAALMLHFCRDQRYLADCTAKEGNQDRGVKLTGIVCAALYLRSDFAARASEGGRALGQEGLPSGCVPYCVLTAMHLVFNWLAMRSLRLEEHAQTAAPDGADAVDHELERTSSNPAKTGKKRNVADVADQCQSVNANDDPLAGKKVKLL